MESGLKRATMKMKRSTSRVTELLSILPTHHSASLPITDTKSTLSDKDPAEDGVEKLCKYSRRSSHTFREIIAVLADRSEAELIYAKSLKKLSGRLGKLVPELTGDVEMGWTCIEAAMAGEASVHQSLGQSLREDIVGPLKSLAESEAKSRRMVETAVEKSLKTTGEVRSSQAKLKRSVHALAKEEEKLEALLEEDSRRPFPVKSEKQTAKAKSRLSKSGESGVGAERAYMESVLEGERSREDSARILASAASRLQGLDLQRRATSQTTLGRLRHLFTSVSADLARSSHGCLEKLESAMSANPAKESRAALTAVLPSTAPYKTVLLADFYAEDFSLKIGAERRKTALTRQLQLTDGLLERERRSQLGLQSLSNIYETSPKFSDQQSRSTVRNKLSDTSDLMEVLSFQQHKLRCAMSSVDNRRFPVPPPHALSQYQDRLKDKSGLWETRLRVPLESGLLSEEASLSASSSESEWGDRREAADGQSPIHSPETEPIYEAVSEPELRFSTKVEIPGSAESADESSDEEREGQYCVALYDFHPQREDEVELRAGGRVRILGQRSSDWWEGEADGEVGLFPVNYVTLSP